MAMNTKHRWRLTKMPWICFRERKVQKSANDINAINSRHTEVCCLIEKA